MIEFLDIRERPSPEDSKLIWLSYFYTTRTKQTPEDKAFLISLTYGPGSTSETVKKAARKRYKQRRRERGDYGAQGSRRQLNRIYERDGAICYHCRQHVEREDASREHLIPIREYGPRDDSNVVLAHIRCNK